MKEKGGKPRGFGFVSFQTVDSANQALAVKHTLCGRVVDAKRCVSREAMSRNDRPLPPSKAPPPSKLHVGNLNLATTDDQFRTFFERFGKLSESLVLQDGSGKSRGFGFVQFEQANHADDVLACAADLELDGHKLSVKRAEPRREDRAVLAPASARGGARVGYERSADYYGSAGGRPPYPAQPLGPPAYSQYLPPPVQQPANNSGWTTYVPPQQAGTGLMPSQPSWQPANMAQQQQQPPPQQQPGMSQWMVPPGAPQAQQAQPQWLTAGMGMGMPQQPVPSNGGGMYAMAAPTPAAPAMYASAGMGGVQTYGQQPPPAPQQPSPLGLAQLIQSSWATPSLMPQQQQQQQQQYPAAQPAMSGVAGQSQYTMPVPMPSDPRRQQALGQQQGAQSAAAPASAWGGVPKPAFTETGQPTYVQQTDARYRPY